MLISIMKILWVTYKTFENLKSNNGRHQKLLLSPSALATIPLVNILIYKQPHSMRVGVECMEINNTLRHFAWIFVVDDILYISSFCRKIHLSWRRIISLASGVGGIQTSSSTINELNLRCVTFINFVFLMLLIFDINET